MMVLFCAYPVINLECPLYMQQREVSMPTGA